MTDTNGRKLKRCDGDLFARVVAILEEARSHVARTVNSDMVMSYWLIGREIVEDEQKGKKRAEYGRALIEDLSRRLTERYGKGFSVPNVRNFRQFYLVYQQRIPEIRCPVGSGTEPERPKRYPTGSESPKGRETLLNGR